MPRSTRPPYPYDCVLDGVGLMLANGPDEAVAWRERKLDFFPARVSQTDSTYAQFPPEDEATWAIDDLSAGFGQRFVPIGGSRRYYYGFADTRIPNQITLAPEVAENATGGGGAIRGHFELGGALYALVGSAVYRTTDGRTWSLSKDFGSGVAVTSAAVFRGEAATSFAFVGVGGAQSDGPYWVFDGATWTAHAGELVDPLAVFATTDGGVTYADYTAALTDDNPATRLPVSSLDTAANGDWVMVGNGIPFTGVSIDMGANVNANSAALTVEYWDGSSWRSVAGLNDGTAPGGATLASDGEIMFDEPADWKPSSVNSVRAFWARLSVSAALDGSTDIDAAEVREPRKADFFLVVGNQLRRVSAEGGAPLISSSTVGGTAATWTIGRPVGDGASAVTNLLSLRGVPYLTKTDGLYSVRGDGSGASARQDVWPHPAQVSHPDNGRGACAWHGYLWLPLRQGFYRFRTTELTPFGPELLEGNDSPIRGRVTACAGDDYFLYAVVRSETGTSYLLALDHDRGSWHPLADLGARLCRHMWISDIPGPNPRLYLGLDGTVGSVVLPRGSPNPLHDANCRYATSADLHLSRFHGNFVAQTKAFLALSVIGEQLSPNTYVDAGYRVDAGAAFARLARYSAPSGQRIELGSAPSGPFIDVRLTLATLDPTTTPIVRAVALAYAVRTGFKRVFEFFVNVSDRLSLRDGGRDRKSAADIKRAVMNAAAADGPVSLVSPGGEVLEVLVTDMEARAQRHEVGRELTWVVPVVATEYRQTASVGSHNRLAAYQHTQLAAYTHTQLAAL